METDTPNIHTPPEEHAPHEAHEHAHPGEDMEVALHEHDHDHPQHPHAEHGHPHHPHEEPPMVILDRRFAKGEINRDVYLESKKLIEKK